MRFAVILQHVIMAYHVQRANIITSKKAGVRKSCYPCILRLRHQSLIVHSRSKVVHVHLLYDDIYSVQIWITRGEGGKGEGGKMSAPSSSSLSVITVTSYRRKIWLLYLFLDIIKRAVFGLACVACKAARGEHAKGRGGLLSFFLIVRLRHFFFPPPPPPPKWRLLRSL